MRQRACAPSSGHSVQHGCLLEELRRHAPTGPWLTALHAHARGIHCMGLACLEAKERTDVCRGHVCDRVAQLQLPRRAGARSMLGSSSTTVVAVGHVLRYWAVLTCITFIMCTRVCRKRGHGRRDRRSSNIEHLCSLGLPPGPPATRDRVNVAAPRSTSNDCRALSSCWASGMSCMSRPDPAVDSSNG